MLEIHPSARKHGIADDDIEHAVTHRWPSTTNQTTPASTSVRPATPLFSRSLTIPTVEGSELAIHAMRMRPKYRHLLPEH